MTVNHGGNLGPDYFRSYLTLIMESRNWDIEGARDYMLETFFHGNPDHFGSTSYDSFVSAVKSLEGADNGD